MRGYITPAGRGEALSGSDERDGMIMDGGDGDVSPESGVKRGWRSRLAEQVRNLPSLAEVEERFI